MYFHGNFLNLCDARFKQGVFVDLRNIKVTFDENFRRKWKFADFSAYKSFKRFVHGFLGNKKEENCPVIYKICYRHARR